MRADFFCRLVYEKLLRMITIKRIYETPAENDGYRVLIDRLWPRGISKEKAKLDEWNKKVAPSTELRKWFGHQPEKFLDFTKKYKLELESQKEELTRLRTIAEQQPLTLLYAAKETKINHANILKSILTQKL